MLKRHYDLQGKLRLVVVMGMMRSWNHYWVAWKVWKRTRSSGGELGVTGESVHT